MNDEPLRNLLHEADRAAGNPTMDVAELSERIRLGVRSRRQRRRVSAVISIAVIGVGTTLLVRAGLDSNATLPIARHSDETPQINVARLRNEYEQLRIEADSRIALLRRVNELRDQQSRMATYAEPHGIDLVREAQNEAEVAARLIVYRADRIYQEPPRRLTALQIYRRAIALFPNTAWADIARERLVQAEFVPGEST